MSLQLDLVCLNTLHLRIVVETNFGPKDTLLGHGGVYTL